MTIPSDVLRCPGDWQEFDWVYTPRTRSWQLTWFNQFREKQHRYMRWSRLVNEA